MPSVISANRLDDGSVTYLGPDTTWVGALAEARVFAAKPDAAAALELARRAVDGNLVVEPFVVEITEAARGRQALSLRDAIRAAGPTIKYGAVGQDFGARPSRSDARSGPSLAGLPPAVSLSLEVARS